MCDLIFTAWLKWLWVSHFVARGTVWPQTLLVELNSSNSLCRKPNHLHMAHTWCHESYKRRNCIAALTLSLVWQCINYFWRDLGLRCEVMKWLSLPHHGRITASEILVIWVSYFLKIFFLPLKFGSRVSNLVIVWIHESHCTLTAERVSRKAQSTSP